MAIGRTLALAMAPLQWAGGSHMQSFQLQTNVRNLTSVELREHMKTRHEAEYALIDVRQAEEYVAGHIPGAVHMPLNELEAYAGELRKLSGRDLVFYCRSGARSARASDWAAQVLGLPKVMNLLGGFSGWGGPDLTSFPRLAAFESDGSVESLLRRALELEKGTHGLYERLSLEYKTGIVAELFSSLVNAESAHARQVHQLLVAEGSYSESTFDEVFASISGNLLENGLPVESMLARAKDLGTVGDAALLDLALEIELGAYDLYKSLALLTTSERSKQVLSELAQQEKAHTDLVLGAIAKLAVAQTGR